VAVWTPGGRIATAAALVEAADAALYAAKALGRNTFTVDPSAETSAPAARKSAA
jgi:PleD family two-component response regulator